MCHLQHRFESGLVVMILFAIFRKFPNFKGKLPLWAKLGDRGTFSNWKFIIQSYFGSWSHPRGPTWSRDIWPWSCHFLLCKIAKICIRGSNPTLSNLILGLFSLIWYFKTNSGGYLCSKLATETIKPQKWKIFCFPLSPTVLGRVRKVGR